MDPDSDHMCGSTLQITFAGFFSHMLVTFTRLFHGSLLQSASLRAFSGSRLRSQVWVNFANHFCRSLFTCVGHFYRSLSQVSFTGLFCKSAFSRVFSEPGFCSHVWVNFADHFCRSLLQVSFAEWFSLSRLK